MLFQEYIYFILLKQFNGLRDDVIDIRDAAANYGSSPLFLKLQCAGNSPGGPAKIRVWPSQSALGSEVLHF